VIIATFTASFTPRHAIMARTNAASVCHHGKGMSPGRPMNVRTAPVRASAVRPDRKVLLGGFAQMPAAEGEASEHVILLGLRPVGRRGTRGYRRSDLAVWVRHVIHSACR
jgi:hypothetical protein